MPEGAIKERIGNRDPEAFQVLLAHNPSYMKEYLAWGADLILSGHLHGGMVRIPGIGGVIGPDYFQSIQEKCGAWETRLSL